MQYFVPNCFVFQRKTLCRRSERVSCAPFSCRGTARGRPLFFLHAEPGNFRQETIRYGSSCFSCETGKLLPRDSPPRLRNRFPTRLQKSWEGEGWGLGGGEGSLSSERFPLPSPSSQNIKNARIKPVALVGGEGLKTDFEVAGIDRSAVHGFDFTDGEFPLVP